MMHSPAVNHIALNCRKAAAQEAFSAKHFGFQRSRTFNAGKPNEYIMLKLGSVRLELFRTDSAKTEHQKGGEHGIGFKHLAFEVPRVEPAIEALRGSSEEASWILGQQDCKRLTIPTCSSHGFFAGTVGMMEIGEVPERKR